MGKGEQVSKVGHGDLQGFVAQRRTEGLGGQEAEGGVNGRGCPMLMATETQRQGQIHKASQRHTEEHLVTECKGEREH